MSSFDAVIIGSGSWGSALAHILLNNNKKILVYSRSVHDKSNHALSNANITITHDPENIFFDKTPIIIATPVNSLSEIGPLIQKKYYKGPILLTCKGVEAKSGLFPRQILSQYAHEENISVLSGPSFAAEVIKNKPTAVTIAAFNDSVLAIFTKMFHSKYFRVYASNDVIGCQVGGAMKNILSVAVGISDGLELGPNAKAALITRGIVEIQSLGKILNCNDKTIYGLSGIGDLVLTSNDNLSRNRRFGMKLAKGESIKEAEKNIGHVVEGIYASQGLKFLIDKHALNLPICSKVFDIINGKISPKDAVDDLLIREQKKEFV
jgi:glycerol-3-phosphate dehydrogenase (NAD(P)+)